jgi:hypothetical protein
MPSTSTAPGDILTGLFESAPSRETDDNQPWSLQAFHRKMIERLFPQSMSAMSASPSSGNQTFSATPSTHQNPVKQPEIDASRVQTLLSRYESLTSYFPFVVLPLGWTVRTMLQNHPFLALGILTAMSAADVSMHRRLDAELRRVLGEKVTGNGERSLDILQGLLVYIAW